MAKKKTKAPVETVTLTDKDKKTLRSIGGLADGVIQSADRGRAPHVEIPSRSLSNVRFNRSKRDPSMIWSERLTPWSEDACKRSS